MNNKVYIILISLFFVVGCQDDFFNLEDPSSFTIDSYYQIEDHANKAITACYATLQKQGLYFREGMAWPDQMSDEFFATGFAAGAGLWGSITNLDISASGGEVNILWNRLYEGIYACIMAIEKVPSIQETDITFTQDKSDFYVGQAYFLRAFYYFKLWSHFGGNIPMITKIAVGTESYYPPAAGDGEVQSLIVSDLKAAQSMLPTVDEYRGTDNLGRASKGSATALLGKYYLYNKEWANAAVEFEKIINNQAGTYALVDYHSLFTDENANSTESIWEAQFAELGGYVWAAGIDNPNQDERQGYTISRSHNRYTNSQYWWNFAIRQDRAEGGRSNTQEESGVRNELWIFEKDVLGNHLDNRLYATFWGVENGATYYFGPKIITWDQQTFSPHPVEGYCYGARKYDVDIFTSAAQKFNGINLIFIRLADVYLMYAEAIMQSDEGTAKEYIQKVRDRANLPMNDQAGMPNTQQGALPSVDQLMADKGWSLTEVLRHERYVELFSEGKRWFDIKRWDIGDEAVGYKPGWPVIKGNNLLIPVPQSEIDNNPNYNGNEANN